MQSFIFGKGTPWTYEELQRKRKIADSLMAENSGTPRNVGEGLASIGRALAVRGINRKADKRDAELKGEFDTQFNAAFGMGATNSGYSAPKADPNSPQGIAADTMKAIGKDQGSIIEAGLVQRGLPEHIAKGFVMNFEDESGLNPGINEVAPTVPGSRGGFGLAQWTGPRRKALETFAAERGKPVDDMELQLDFLLTELQGPESAAWKNISGAKTAGEAGAAIVNDFLRPADVHRVAREQEYLGGAPSMDIGRIAELAGNPYATPGQRAILEALMQQQMAASDPMNRIELETAQLELDALKNPGKPKPFEVGGVLLDPETMQPIFDSRQPASNKPPTSVAEYQFYTQEAAKLGKTPMSYEEFLVADEKASVPPGAPPGVPPDEEALRTSLGKKEGETWSAYLDTANTSAGTVQDMEMLDELVAMAPQGPISGRLANSFTGVNSAADAFNSVVKRVAPTLRAPGSGATSDIEYEGMLKSLPQLAANPEANVAIIGMVKAKAQMNIERGQVVADYQSGKISAVEARDKMAAINSRSIMTPELKAVLSGVAPPDASAEIGNDDAEYLRSLGLEP